MSELDRSLIKSFSLFENLDDQQLDAVLARAKTRRVPQGQPVFEQGQAAEEFFVLLHGRLQVGRVTPDGQQTMVRVVNPGELFGFAKALQRGDYPGTAVAAVESLMLVWPMSAWENVVEENALMAVNAMHAVGQRLQEAHTRIVEMSTEDVERRVAHAVLRLVQQSGRKVEGGIAIDFPISRQDIAEMTATTLHTVSRILSGWEDEGLVRGGRQKLTVLKPHQLLLRAEGLDKSAD